MPLANVSRPMGFIPLMTAGKTPKVRPRPVPAVRTSGLSAGGNTANASTALAVGDAVAIDGSGNAHRAGPGDVVIGICVGFRFLPITGPQNSNSPISEDFSAAGSVDTALVCEDADAEFIVQTDTFAAANVGGKFNLSEVAAPDPLYSQSRQTLGVGFGAGIQFQAQDILQDTASNAYGANARVVVRLLQTFDN